MHRPRRPRLGWLGALTIVAGCGQAPQIKAPVAESEATWSFTASMPARGGGLVLEGSFTAVGDTLLLEVEGATCFPAGGGLNTFRYQCPGNLGTSTAERTITGATFNFWRHRPADRPTVQLSVATTTMQNVCVRYVTSPSGTQTCASWSRQPVTVNVTETGTLRTQRVSLP